MVKVPDFTEAYQHRVRVLGRNLLVKEDGPMGAMSLRLYDVLTGISGAHRDIVLLNAAAALVAAGLAEDLKEGVAQGTEAIDSGQAAATLEKLRRFGSKYAGKPN